MKRITIVTILLFAVVTCFAEHVKTDDANKVARNFLKNNNANYEALEDVSNPVAFDNIYVFTTSGSFVVMSADDCVRPVLGYSLTEGFDVNNIPDNMKSWLGDYSVQIQLAIDNSAKASSEIRKMWDDLKNRAPNAAKANSVVEPLLSTTWNQNYPYNYYCPADANGPQGRVYAGCLATALAQVMKYWNYPEVGQGSHTYEHGVYGVLTADFGATTYNWSQMPDNLTNSSPQAEIDAVATLIYQCGIAVDMNYGPNGSGAYYYKVPGAFKDFFRYSESATLESQTEYSNEGWIAMLKSELDEGRPMYYCGNNENSGHAFVCDGYRSDDYFHINWGWSGYMDDYWAIGALNPDPYTFNLTNMAVRFVEPIYDLPAPTLTVSAQQGHNVLSWDAIPGAVSYDVYRDAEKIATAYNGTEYEDSDVGFCVYHKYYVRALDAISKSNPSNVVEFKNTFRSITPSNLTATLNGNNVGLGWTGYNDNMSVELRYGLNHYGFSWGYMGSYDTYWGQKYPASTLSGFEGMSIDKVSVYISEPGDYKMYLYKNNTYTTNNQLVEHDFTATSMGWFDIELSNPICLDVTKDLWVVFYADMSIQFPAAYGDYSNPDGQYAKYLATDLSYFGDYSVEGDYSWVIKVHFTEGTYSYSIYRNNTLIVDNQQNTEYVDANLTDGEYTYYVKTNYQCGSSAASNEVTVLVGDPVHIAEVSGGELVVFPNPAKNNLLIESKENIRQCDIYTVGGALVYSTNNCSSSFEIDITDLPLGVFVIKLQSEYSVYTIKFVKD